MSLWKKLKTPITAYLKALCPSAPQESIGKTAPLPSGTAICRGADLDVVSMTLRTAHVKPRRMTREGRVFVEDQHGYLVSWKGIEGEI